MKAGARLALLAAPLISGLQVEVEVSEVCLLQTAASVSHEFQPSQDFTAAGELQPTSQRSFERPSQEAGQRLPYGVASPPNEWNPSAFETSWPIIDVPKEMEYSLDHGDTIRSYSVAKQDVKILTQLFPNVTNGFFVETHARDGEQGSNTLLFELLGWRGLVMEPRLFWYINLWSKFRKAWLFMGSISPDGWHRKVGFDSEGRVDMLSGHRVHVHPMVSFMSEMGGRKTIDFWSLNNGGFEAEVLNETLLGSGSKLEIGVICVTINYRLSGRGHEPWAETRSRDQAEQLIYEILHEAGWKAVGGLNAYWVNTVIGRHNFHDAVFVNPQYFEKRDLPVPTKIHAEPPPKLTSGSDNQLKSDELPLEWDKGLTHKQESRAVVEYIQKSRTAAAPTEIVPRAHRHEETFLKLALPGNEYQRHV